MLKKTNKSSDNRGPDRVPNLSIHEVDLVTSIHMLVNQGSIESIRYPIFVIYSDT